MQWLDIPSVIAITMFQPSTDIIFTGKKQGRRKKVKEKTNC